MALHHWEGVPVEWRLRKANQITAGSIIDTRMAKVKLAQLTARLMKCVTAR